MAPHGTDTQRESIGCGRLDDAGSNQRIFITNNIHHCAGAGPQGWGSGSPSQALHRRASQPASQLVEVKSWGWRSAIGRWMLPKFPSGHVPRHVLAPGPHQPWPRLNLGSRGDIDAVRLDGAHRG